MLIGFDYNKQYFMEFQRDHLKLMEHVLFEEEVTEQRENWHAVTRPGSGRWCTASLFTCARAH